MNHTPRPWSVVHRTGKKQRDTVYIYRGREALFMQMGRAACPERPFNAALVSAAPDLLEEIEKAMNEIPSLSGRRGLLMAVKKAKGE